MRSGPTVSIAPSVSFRIEYEPSIPIQSAERSSDSASTLGSQPIGIDAVTVSVFGSMAVRVFGYVSVPPAKLT